ncbi:MAG: hypothetical protein IJ799_05475 [Bacteroidales bacterium]|nr:hypothetical protein [Bacteroidales bacterium]
MRKTIAICTLLLATLSLGARPKYITYEKFGARGDGVHDDFPAIVAAHEAANRKGLPVRARDGRKYYIGGGKQTAVIRTDTDFGKAEFIIDDTSLEDISSYVFSVESDSKPFKVRGIGPVSKGQENLGVKLPCRCVVEIRNDGRKTYIRKGLNRNDGTAQREMLLVDADGTISGNSRPVWDYGKVTSATAYPIDEKPLTIKGGVFTTIANLAESRYDYHGRGFTVSRSNVHIEGMTHKVTGEGKNGAPYAGFISMRNSSGITMKDCLMTGHKTYKTIGSAGLPVAMGSYDINASSCIGLLFENCTQTNSIDDRAYWGTFTSNFCKDLTLKGCILSRFDAHQGVDGVTLQDCTFGHQAVQMVGFGTILLENCEVHADWLVSLRGDYGSTWDGNIMARNCTLKARGRSKSVSILSGHNDGSHDFGYPCRLPREIRIEGLRIDDSTAGDCDGPYVLASFSRKAGVKEPFPFGTDCEVVLKNVSVASGKPLVAAPNPEAFPGLNVTRR